MAPPTASMAEWLRKTPLATSSTGDLGVNAFINRPKRIIMYGPDGPDAADDPEGGPWSQPRMGPLGKVGLTLLMVALGVVPGLMLMASDPLPGPSGEDPPEARPSPGAAEARDEAPVHDDAPAPVVARPDTPAVDADDEDEDGDAERDRDDEREPRDRPRRGGQADEGRSDSGAKEVKQEDDDADEADDDDGDADDRWSISIRLGG